MQPAVFLDRDNTIIHNDGDLGDPAQVRLIQGAASAISSLCGLGYKIVVVTNQGGVARGKYSEDDVQRVHERVREAVTKAANGARIDAFYYCPYHPEGTVEKYRKEHPTRKPQPGMLKQAAREMKLDLARSWMIGDQLRDVQAGKAAHCRTVLLKPDADWIDPDEPVELPESASETDQVKPDVVARSLIEAVRVIAQHRKPEAAEESAARLMTSSTRRWDASAVAKLQRTDAKTVETTEADETQKPAEDGEALGRKLSEVSPRVAPPPAPPQPVSAPAPVEAPAPPPPEPASP
ncbi:MAG: D-glycero-alpha-D-manno-heptose-1,7-bisphosphate 7-phosphatase, partial [Phycisphaeraceae bacterium]